MTTALALAAWLSPAFAQTILPLPPIRPPAPSETQEPGTSDEAVLARRTFQPFVQKGEIVGVVVGVVDASGARVYGFGETVRGNGKTPDGSTLFEIGSITKVFTGVMLADATLRGVASLEDPIGGFLPGRMPSRDGKNISLLHLATHTSGLPRLPDNITPADPDDPYADYGADRLLAFLSSHELARAPGADWEYSNLGFGLLGHLLERAERKSYAGLLAALTERLGLRDTVIEPGERAARLAQGHRQGVATPAWRFDALAGAGAVRSTADDLLRFAAINAGLHASGLADALAEARSSRHTIKDDVRIGLGWLLAPFSGRPTCFHNGGTYGFTSSLVIDLEKKRGVVLLVNSWPVSEAFEVASNRFVKEILDP